MFSFFHTTEFYVLLLTLAAALVALIVKPANRQPAQTSFSEGMLTFDSDATPRIEIRCLQNGDVVISRCGLQGLTASATIALAITRINFNLDVEERITSGHPADAEINRADFIIRGLSPERYHLKYNSSSYSLFLATGFSIRPDYFCSRQFPQ